MCLSSGQVRSSHCSALTEESGEDDGELQDVRPARKRRSLRKLAGQRFVYCPFHAFAGPIW